MTTDPLVADYLRRLAAEAAALPPERRAELLAEIREHLDEALREVGSDDEVAVRNVLERLGPPDEIVHAAAPPAPLEAPRRAGFVEVAALVALVLPILGWLIGVVLVLASHIWSRRDKTVGLLLVLLPALLPLIVIMSGAESGSDVQVPAEDGRPVGEEQSGDGTGVGPAELFLIFLAGLPSALYLAVRLRAGR